MLGFIYLQSLFLRKLQAPWWYGFSVRWFSVVNKCVQGKPRGHPWMMSAELCLLIWAVFITKHVLTMMWDWINLFLFGDC